MAALHADEVVIADATVRQLVDRQFPQWAHLSLTNAGHGTDNRMVRLGDDLLIRLPRTPGTAADVAKEQTWLPRLAPHLPLSVPEPVALGRPEGEYPFAWSVYRWIDGREAAPTAITDPLCFGRDLAAFVRALHGIDLMGARRDGALMNYRGGRLRDLGGDTLRNIAACHDLELDLDLPRLEQIWRAAVDLDEPVTPDVWMHTDLRPANLIVRDGVLVGVVDFGGLSVGAPTAEHTAVWDLPAEARLTYADELRLERSTRIHARGWALAIAVSGVPYYWRSWPDFARECVRRLRAIVAAEV